MRKVKNKSLEKDLIKFIKQCEHISKDGDGTVWMTGYCDAMDAVACDLKKILGMKEHE